MENEREEFIKEREEKYQGIIDYLAFARLKGQSGTQTPLDLSGTIYIINNVFYFEDFEPQLSPLITWGKRPKFTRTEFSINGNDITEVAVITKKTSTDLIYAHIENINAPKLKKGVKSFFSSTFLTIEDNKGDCFIFECIDNFSESIAIKKILPL